MDQNTSAPAMGQWVNAPLVFVLTQVRFPNQPDGFTERVQLAISALQTGKFLPAQAAPVMQVQLEIEQGGIPKQTVTQIGMAYNMTREDGRMLVRIESASLTLAVNEYIDSKHLMGQWLPMVACLAEAGFAGGINRLGLRYVDFIIPQSGAAPEDYVNPPWNLTSTPRIVGSLGAPGMHMSVHDMEFQRGRMRLQYIRGHGKPALPTDLAGLLEPSKKAETDGETAVIDTDRWIEGEWAPDQAQIKADFRQMHSDLSAAFKTIVSTRARTEWGEPVIKGDAS